MSKTIKVTYGVSIMMGEHWQKIDIEQLPDKDETMETVLDEVCERVKSWHKNKYPDMYQKKETSSRPTPMELNEGIENKEWEAIKKRLMEIEFLEDAQEYIRTTDYAMTVEAKKIINNKPLKK